MKSPLIRACSLLLFAGFVVAPFAQAQRNDAPAGGQVESKTDRFSNVTTVKLKPTDLFRKQNQRLAISLETKLDPKKPNEDTVMVHFISYTQYPMNFGDRELHALIDGKPLRLGQAFRGDLALFPGSAETLYVGVSLEKLNQIVSGKNVEMRLGSVEWTLSNPALSAIRDFVNTAKERMESFKSKGK